MPSGTNSNRSLPQAAELTGDDVTVTKPASPANVSTPNDGATPPSAALLALLRPPQADGELGRLAGFGIVALLGNGGMGAVFVAHDPIVRRRIALKVMKPEMTARPESYQRFLREARTAAAVEHDHIIPVYQVGEDNGVLFIAMPLLKGEPLDRRLSREPKLSMAAILKLGREVAEGLAAAHTRELIHRDIKPGNLWLEETEEVGAEFRRIEILDFGLARAVHDDNHLTAAGGVLGTPAYMAPEQADGQAVDHRADLFGLGAVLYRCCTGKSPFSGPNTMAILSALANKTPVPVREQNPDVPQKLADLIMRLLAKTPVDRLQTAAEVAAEIRHIERENTIPSVAKIERRPRYRLAMACVAAILGLTVAGVVVVKVRGPDGKESEVTAPEGSKIAVDDKGNVAVTLPPDAPKPALAPPTKQADPAELECRLKAGNSIVYALVITPDGKNVIAGYAEGCLRVWDLRERKIVRTHTTGSEVRALALHPDGKTVAVNCTDGSLFTWDAVTGKVVRRFTGHPVCDWSLSFARRGESLITSDDETKSIVCWDTATGMHKVLAHYPKESGYGLVQVAPDGEHIALVPDGAPVQLLELSSGKSTWTSRWPGYWAAPVFTSDGKTIAFPAGWGNVAVWDLASRNPKSVYRGAVGLASGLAISPTNRFLAVAFNSNRQVQLFDRAGPTRPIRVWAGLPPYRVAFTPDGRRLLSTHDNGTICVFKVPENLPHWRGFPPLDSDWLARTIKLPTDDQVQEVTAELIRRNPGFNDPVNVLKDSDGRVWNASVQTVQLEDLSPFRGFPALRELAVEPKEGIGKVWDLSCLRGMHLTTLRLRGNRIRDVSPLRDMPLTSLLLDNNPLYDLSTLQKMGLRAIGLCATNVDDISPLKGMPLESAWLHYTSIKDLSPLSKAPIKGITVSAPDLEPLHDLPLEWLELRGDYKPEQLKMILRIPTMKEIHLWGKYDPMQLKEFRGNSILKTINDKPAAEFWKTADKTIPDKKGKTPNGD